MHQNGKEYTFLSSVPSLLVKNGFFIDWFFSSVFPLQQRTLGDPFFGGGGPCALLYSPCSATPCTLLSTAPALQSALPPALPAHCGVTQTWAGALSAEPATQLQRGKTPDTVPWQQNIAMVCIDQILNKLWFKQCKSSRCLEVKLSPRILSQLPKELWSLTSLHNSGALWEYPRNLVF